MGLACKQRYSRKSNFVPELLGKVKLASLQHGPRQIGQCRNVRGLGKSTVVFRLFEKLRYSNEKSTKFESLNHEQKYLEEENGKMVALQILPKIESLYGLGRQATKL